MQITMQTKPVSVLISAFTHSSGGRNPTCMYQTKHDQERTHLQGSQRMMSSQWGGGWFNEAAGGENPQLSWRPCDRSQVHLYQGTCDS